MKWGTIAQVATPIVLLVLCIVLVYLSVFQQSSTQVPKNDELTAASPPLMQNPNLKITILSDGRGQVAEVGSIVNVYYRGMLENGTVFDQNENGEGFQFTLGSGQVIEGWELGIQGMRVGEKRALTIPPDLAYGESGFPGAIPPNATLLFDVELRSVH